jgi:hypothetical protein
VPRPVYAESQSAQSEENHDPRSFGKRAQVVRACRAGSPAGRVILFYCARKFAKYLRWPAVAVSSLHHLGGVSSIRFEIWSILQGPSGYLKLSGLKALLVFLIPISHPQRGKRSHHPIFPDERETFGRVAMPFTSPLFANRYRLALPLPPLSRQMIVTESH